MSCEDGVKDQGDVSSNQRMPKISAEARGEVGTRLFLTDLKR